VKSDWHVIVGESRIALGNPGFTVTRQRAKDAVTDARCAKPFEYHRFGAGVDRAAAAGFVADADDAVHIEYLLIPK
jgi:hypothetical protein